MANPVKGKNVFLEVYDETDLEYILFTCAESCSINFSPELIDKTTYSTGSGVNWHERRRGWDVVLSGVTDIVSDGRTVFEMVDPDEKNTVHEIRLSFEDDLGNTAVFTGKAKMERTAINAAEVGFSDYELNLKGCSMYELLTTIDGVVGGAVNKILMEDGDDIFIEEYDPFSVLMDTSFNFLLEEA